MYFKCMSGGTIGQIDLKIVNVLFKKGSLFGSKNCSFLVQKRCPFLLKNGPLENSKNDLNNPGSELNWLSRLQIRLAVRLMFFRMRAPSPRAG